MTKIKKIRRKLQNLDAFEIARILDTYYEVGYDETVKQLNDKKLLDYILQYEE